MSLELIKFAFAAGELSPSFLGRTDLEKYDFGLATAVNWFVDYRGGLTTRPGTIFGDWVKGDPTKVKMFEFKYAPTIANTYVMLFGNEYIRFIQENAYVLEDPVTITGITKANPGVVTAVGHNYADGDWVKLSVVGMTEVTGRTVIVANKTANTFELTDPLGDNINTTTFTTFTSGTVRRIYTVTSPYTEDDIAGLTLFQERDLVRITSLDFAPRELIRTDHTDWAISYSEFGAVIERPTDLVVEATVPGYPTPPSQTQASSVWAVTAVNAEGDESLPSDYVIEDSSTDYSASQGSIKSRWTPVVGAVSYNVYRSVLVSGAFSDISRSQEVGYLGRAYGASFIDGNIVPDFTKTPPQHFNPFASRTIENCDIDAGGAGYDQDSILTVTDAGGGTGFIGFVIVSDTGAVVGVKILNGGSGYVTPVASITVGAGADISFNISPETGMWPAISAVFQQRQLYAASINDPLTIWGSRPKRYDNFDISAIVADNDSYEFELDAEEVTPIRHMVPVRGGLLTLTDGGVWLITGGGLGDPVTPSNVLADSHTYTGISTVPPLRNDTDLIYIESKGFTVRLLEYNDFSRVYSGKDISILSNHMFSGRNYITRWTFASEPFKIVWARRLDGTMLSFTMVKEQNVFAWTRAQTQGLVQDVLAVQEGTTDTVYLTVKRYVNGEWVGYFETFAPRVVTHVEDYHGVDCGLALGTTSPAADITLSASTGTITVTADAAVFTSGDTDKIWRGGGGKGIATFVDSTHISVALVRDITSLIPEDADATPLPLLEGEWTLDAEVTSVGGLWHLEGKSVSILLDGNVMPTQSVEDGTVDLGGSGTRAIVGLPFTCEAKSLPLTVPQTPIENRRKRVMGVGVRLHETRGLQCGASRDKLYVMKERTTEAYGEPTNLLTRVRNVLVQPKWDEDGELYMFQEDPLPASVLGYVISTEVGDDTD